MKKHFNIAFDILLHFEGGYVNDKYDKGGETKYGISKRAYPDLDIENLTIEDAKNIYYKDYWLKAKCDKILFPVNIFHFDTAVNCGVYRANRCLQIAISRSGFPIGIDGIIGNQTLTALNRCNIHLLLMNYAIVRTEFYITIGDSRFLKGWLRRVIKLYSICKDFCLGNLDYKKYLV